MGWINAIASTPIVDKEQAVQQMQAQVNQANTDAQAHREQSIRQTTVTHTPDGEKLRMRRRRREERDDKRRKRTPGESVHNLPEDAGNGKVKRRRRVNLTV